jgi:hypothetical protein
MDMYEAVGGQTHPSVRPFPSPHGERVFSNYGQEVRLAPEPVWMVWIREQSLVPASNRTLITKYTISLLVTTPTALFQHRFLNYYFLVFHHTFPLLTI